MYSFVLVFYECTFHHTLGPGYGEHTLWRRVHTLIPGYIPGYGTSKVRLTHTRARDCTSHDPHVHTTHTRHTQIQKNARAAVPCASTQPGPRPPLRGTYDSPQLVCKGSRRAVLFGLYTILSLLILCCVWHIKGGSGGGHILRKSRTIVLQ